MCRLNCDLYGICNCIQTPVQMWKQIHKAHVTLYQRMYVVNIYNFNPSSFCGALCTMYYILDLLWKLAEPSRWKRRLEWCTYLLGMSLTNELNVYITLYYKAVFYTSNEQWTNVQSIVMYQQIQHEATLSLQFWDDPTIDGFQALLMTPKPMIRTYDHVYQWVTGCCAFCLKS